jgi:hypothetical protein
MLWVAYSESYLWQRAQRSPREVRRVELRTETWLWQESKELRHASRVPLSVITSQMSHRFGVTLLLSLSLHRFWHLLRTSSMDVFTSVYEQEWISPDEAAQVIVAALADPASVPLACIDILLYSYGVLSRLWNEPEHDHRYLFRRYRYVLRCTMRFLCSFRSAEQFRVLKQTLERGPCRCAQGPEALHKLISPSRHRNLLILGTGRIPRLVPIMSAMLSSTIARQGGLQTLHRAVRRSLWPTSMNDFVHDGSTSLHNLVRWLPQMDADTPYQETCMLICNVFEAMPSYLRAGFIKGPIQ